MSDHDASYLNVLSLLVGQKGLVTVLDIGANIGEFSELAFNRLGAGRAVAVEPTPHIYAALVEKFKGEPRFEGVHECVGAFSAQLEFLVHEETKTSSLFPRETGRRYFAANDRVVSTTLVPAKTLDEICRDHGTGHIDLIKLDTQGAEFDIFRGARELLAGEAIDIIYTEFFITSHYVGAPLLPEIWALLEKFDYSLYDLFKGPLARMVSSGLATRHSSAKSSATHISIHC